MILPFLFLLCFFSLIPPHISSDIKVNCNRTYYGNYNHKGVISSYNFPFDYRNNLTCVHRIFLPSAQSNNESRKICFLFSFFSMENSYCSFDKLIILEGSFKKKYCGKGLYHYGIEVNDNPLSNVWFPNFCWDLRPTISMFNLTFITDDNINGTGFQATYEVFSSIETPHSMPSTNQHVGGRSHGYAPCGENQWPCPSNRKCISSEKMCNGEKDCEEGEDESFSFARCRDSQSVRACDFSERGSHRIEEPCGLNLEGWEVVHLPLSSSHSPWKPDLDHTNGTNGSYLLASEFPALFVSSSQVLLSSRPSCLRFWYVLSGNRNKSLQKDLRLSLFLSEDQAFIRPEWFVDLYSSSPSFSDVPAWQQLPRQHKKRKKVFQSMNYGNWKLAEVALETKKNPFTILMNVRSRDKDGSSSGLKEKASEKGTVAIDDISILDGPCSGVDIQCNFESSLCGWTSEIGVFSYSHNQGKGQLKANYVWGLHGNGDFPIRKRAVDKSSSDGSGNFAHVFFPPSSPSSSLIISKDSALFFSLPVSSIFKEHLCLSFWFWKSKEDFCQLRLLVLSPDNRLSPNLWSDKQDGQERRGREEEEEDFFDMIEDKESSFWSLVRVNITSSGPFRFILEASRVDSGEECEVGLDGLRLDRRFCRSGCLPSEFQCQTGQCVASDLRCNSSPDCPDASDEENCVSPSYNEDYSFDNNPASSSSSSSSSSSHKCQPPAISFCNICLPHNWICDYVDDCLDGSDELNCEQDRVYGEEGSILGREEAGNSKDPMEYERGGGEDYDELCTEEDFHCFSNNECVSMSDVCDGFPSCTDKSDEANCTQSPSPGCPPLFENCSGREGCVDPSMYCDGKEDCPGGSDELQQNCLLAQADSSKNSKTVPVIVGVVSAILLFLLLIICVSLFLIFSKRRRQKRVQGRTRGAPVPSLSSIAIIFNSPNVEASKQQQLNKSLIPNSSDNNNNNNKNFHGGSQTFSQEDKEINSSYNNLGNSNHNNHNLNSHIYLPQANDQLVHTASTSSFERLDLSISDKPSDQNKQSIVTMTTNGDVPSNQNLSSPSQMRNPNIVSKQKVTIGGGGVGISQGKVLRSSIVDHIYEEPSGLMSLLKRHQLPMEDGMLMGRVINQNCSPIHLGGTPCLASSNPPSSATCNRISRIRLGTTALQTRGNSQEGWTAETRGHATMGRVGRHANQGLEGRRKSGGFDMDRMTTSPISTSPLMGEMLRNGEGVPEEEVMMMIMREPIINFNGNSKSSTPADSSNSSSSATSNTRLLPNSTSHHHFNNNTNNFNSNLANNNLINNIQINNNKNLSNFNNNLSNLNNNINSLNNNLTYNYNFNQPLKDSMETTGDNNIFPNDRTNPIFPFKSQPPPPPLGVFIPKHQQSFN